MVYSEVDINNEEDIINIIKNNDLNRIKEIFSNINVIKLNLYFKKVLFYLIEENYSFDIIKFLIEKLQKQQCPKEQKQKQSIYCTELLFYSIGCNNFKIAKLLMNNGTRIDNLNAEFNNVIEYLIGKRKLDSENLFFILNVVRDASLITSNVLCDLIELNNYVFIKEILQYKYYNKRFIINFLLYYKNKTKLSDKELRNINSLNKMTIKINNKTKTNSYPFLRAISLNNIKIVKLLMDYANKYNIVLKINEKDVNGNSSLKLSITNNNIEIVKLLIRYANEHKIILNINEKNKNGWTLLITANANNINNTEIVKLLMKYADEHNIILKINEKNPKGNNSLNLSIANNNIEIVKLLMEYADKHRILLDINEKNPNGFNSLNLSIINNNIEMVKLLMEYANKHKIIMKINEKNKNGWSPIISANANNINNSEIVKLIMDYADDHNIILELNEKDKNGNHPLKLSINNNNIEIVKLLMEYADKHHIILDINVKNKNEYNLLDLYIKNNDIAMAKFLMGYTDKRNIIKKINENINNKWTPPYNTNFYYTYKSYLALKKYR